MSSRLPALAVLALLLVPDAAHAQAPGEVVVAGETWKHTVGTGGTDVFRRADGVTVEVAPASQPCAQQPRPGEVNRYDWVAPAYWPKIDATAGMLVLCLQTVSGQTAVTVKPAGGKPITADVAPILAEIARLVRPPTVVPELGAFHPSAPVAVIANGGIGFAIGDGGVAMSLSHAKGSCGYEHAIASLSLGTASSSAGFAEGYWKTTIASDTSIIGCLDLADGYLSLIVSPAAGLPALADSLAEVRRAAYAKHGAPITNDTDPMILPRTQQRVSAKTGSGMWKVADGGEHDAPGSDALVSTFPLGFGYTRYVITVGEGPCAPGDTPAPPDVAARVFPAGLGPAWVDARPYLTRWRAWVCVAHGGATATISVVGRIALTEPPDATEAPGARAMIAAIARSYGLDVTDAPPAIAGGTGGGGTGGGGGGKGYGQRVLVQTAGYVGVLSLQPEGSDRRTGGLVGLAIRAAQTTGTGLAFGFDVELGYGGGEFLGEIRTGIGLAFGRRVVVDVILGGNVGSTGPAAAIDLYGEASISIPRGRGLIWLGGLHAVGVAGPDHTRGEVRFAMPTRRDGTGLYLGARYVRFGPTAGADGFADVDNGAALLVTVGAGAVAHD